MPNNDKPTDTQAIQAGKKASATPDVSGNAKKATENSKKGSQNANKTSSSTKKATTLPQRSKTQASASGTKPPVAQTRLSKLGAFQPCRGVFNTTSGTSEWIPYEPNSREFLLLADAYNMGMRLLERPDASAKLVELGRLCVKDWKKKAKVTGYNWSGDETKMTEYVNHFLEKYRNQTTRFQVSSKNLGDAYAESVFDMGYVLPDLFRLDPKALTSMVLDKELFEAVAQNDARRAKLFASGAQENVTNMKAFAQARKQSGDLGLIHQALLGAIIFHELAHCFVFYLGMNGDPNTPPGVSGLAVRTGTGESGAWLENHVLGGTLVMRDNVLYLVDDEEEGHEVDLPRMKEFVNKPESFNLKEGLPIKLNGRKCSFKTTQRSESVSPDTRQRAIFRIRNKHTTAYDVYPGRDINGLAIHASIPKAVAIAA